MEQPEAILIAGPTASGKSALAVALARRVGGTVVNADSMQVYDGLRILSARPSVDEMGGVEHRLYGHVPPDAPYSAGVWLREVEALLPELRARGQIPVFCGGTGLYFKALLGGFDDLPEIPSTIRERWRTRMAQEGPTALHRVLTRLDPEAAARLRPSDPQRILRALELFETTGAPLGQLQRGAGAGLVERAKALKLVLTPDRALLRERIARRFDAMLAEGAAEEAEAFSARPGAATGLAANAIGVAELARMRAGELTPTEARDLSVTRTRQYAKRQETWFRHQFDETWLRFADPAEALAALEARLPGLA
ncbi:tRNA (adenosine(37)-N6)-dimethylallyltransferase MiaA [Aureimonas sp. D3]|uniref:tRNA (adenosine(37)-N6)-dimethylallyltransferase MiaA n=1 Tax=Aureimonas sp. D3 TaxID=1638164 RepID=UPI00078170B7|nr:tRNA (adenosine(37)-N6)-dimethylallyltransferase MiaA [Aureimonas sp. D3]